MIRILVADDHLVVRSGLNGMLASQPDFTVVGEADDGAEAVRLALRLEPDLVLMDLRMPGTDGVAAIEELHAAGSTANVLVLTTYDSDADILRAVEAGATGYLLKDAGREEIYAAVRSAASSGRTGRQGAGVRVCVWDRCGCQPVSGGEEMMNYCPEFI